MSKFFATVGAVATFSLAAISMPNAAPVPGFEALYAAAFAACTPPAGTPEACEAAINDLSAAMIAAGIPQDVALASFTELRAEVVAEGGFEDIFEELLPDSGAISGTPADASPV
ncbi:hypothetical protein [Devosia sediminis]|uniref:Uncharacterized protein n=1 Tax=Devosia sediminis TaxID=2798801 RepID=A0A934IVK6_9HYPH|nr:hypothetical protein [Devosia sediminis]MBJ3783117.1 hypothetical protein [Devosia sediminis]